MLSFEYNAAMILCCSDNITKDYVLRIGQVQEVKLLIIVMNGNEEAHEATVSIEMPPAFEYLGTDDRVCVWLLHLFCESSIQSNMNMHHYVCIALCVANILHKGRFWAASLASGSSVPKDDRSSLMLSNQVFGCQ